MLKTLSLLVCLFAFADANAFSKAEMKDGLGFSAPTISDKANVYSPVVGEIVYDESDSTFYGRDHSSNWVALGGAAAANAVSSSASGERVERAVIENNAGTVTVISSSGSWIQSVSHLGTGSVQVNFVSATFSDDPTCTCVAVGTDQCSLSANPTTSGVVVNTTTDSTPHELDINIICMGPQ